MKRLRVLLVVISLLFALAACQEQPQAEPTEVPAAVESEAEIIEEQAAEEGQEAAQEAAAVAEEPTAVPSTEEPAEEPLEEEPAEEVAAGSASDLPAAEIMNDEGGPVRLVGAIDYTDFSIPQVMTDPAPTLLDMVHVVQGEPTLFAPVGNQILGTMTDDVNPPPLGYEFDLPVVPRGAFLDVDNDGEDDQGVQIFRLAMASNINGGSHLEQLDQLADLNSYLVDPITGRITEGSLLLYAADDQQGFPSGLGDDGALFTDDDPAVGLPQGYTVVHFGPDGVTFDRSAEAELNVLEKASAASSDFSEQGILESFNSLIDELAERYSFTDFRNLDWEAIRAENLPQVEELDALVNEDPVTAVGQYTILLANIAQSLRDAHVAASIDTSSPAYQDYANALLAPIATNVGANTSALDDGRIIVTYVAPGSPAEAAGWTFGTEIVAVEGTPVAERIPEVYYYLTTGTDEGQRLRQVANLLKFPAGAGEVTVDAILTGATEPQSFAMTPGQYTLPDPLQTLNEREELPIEYVIGPNFGYISWDEFVEPDIRIAVFEQFLKEVNANEDIGGVILDMRGNGGGWDNLYFTMASYFFNEDNPVSMHWIDQDVYDPESGELVRETAPAFLISAPKPELYYDGPVLVLVDNNCASSCEFFSQFLQTNGRAQVIAQYGTKGAGAAINHVDLPGGIFMQYTKGRAYFAGTDEFNLEAVGVTPDIRVPTTEETERAKLEGGDPVLQTALDSIAALTLQAFVDSIVMQPLPADMTPGYSAVVPEGWNVSPLGPGVQAASPDGQMLLGYNARTDEEMVDLFNQLGIEDPQAAISETREVNGREWTIYDSPVDSTYYRAASTLIDGTNYVIFAATVGDNVQAVSEGILYPAMENFMVGDTVSAAPAEGEFCGPIHVPSRTTTPKSCAI